MTGRQHLDPPLDPILLAQHRNGPAAPVGREPELGEDLVDRDARGHVAWQQSLVLDQRLQHGDHMRIAVRLRTAERPCKAPNIRNMRGNFTCYRHPRHLPCKLEDSWSLTV